MTLLSFLMEVAAFFLNKHACSRMYLIPSSQLSDLFGSLNSVPDSASINTRHHDLLQVTYDPQVISPEKICEVIDDAGFEGSIKPPIPAPGHVTLVITGMTCESCVKRVEHLVMTLDGEGLDGGGRNSVVKHDSILICALIRVVTNGPAWVLQGAFDRIVWLSHGVKCFVHIRPVEPPHGLWLYFLFMNVWQMFGSPAHVPVSLNALSH